MKKLTESQVKNIKEKLIKSQNELIRKNRIKKDNTWYYGSITYNGIKDIRYLSNEDQDEDIKDIRYVFNEEDIYNGINDIKYLFNENEDKITHNSNIKYKGIKDMRYLFNENEDKITHNSNIRCLLNENEDKESPFKSIVEDIKRGLYYVEKMNNLSTLDIKSIKEKSMKFKNELFKNNNNNNNNKIKKRSFKDLNEYKRIKDIRYLFNDNIYKGIIDIRYLFNEDYYVKMLDTKNIKGEFSKLSNNLVKACTKDIRYMVDHINNGEKLRERPINLEDIRDKFIAYNDNLPFGILSDSSYIDLKKMKIVSSVTFDDGYKILKKESRTIADSLRTLKMPLFLGFLRDASKIHFNDVLEEEELLQYIKLNRNKVQYVWIDEFKK